MKSITGSPEFLEELPLFKSQSSKGSNPQIESGLSISFGWTSQYLSQKTCTRRIWKDAHAAKFIKAFNEGKKVQALDKDKRYGGKQIGWCHLTCAPYKEKLADMPLKDIAAEGGMVESIEEFIKKYFDGNALQEVWVIRFEFEELKAKNQRHTLDFYESPHWFVTDTLRYVEVSGIVGECCVGSGAIASLLNYYPAITSVWTNDIDPEKQADHHIDATKPWDNLPEADWIITNPPFGVSALPILMNAYNHAKRGVIMFLRQTFLEPCSDRAEFLAAHPPTLELVFPRFKFRKDKLGRRWQTDNCTICAFVWDKEATFQQTIIRPASNISLFHDHPENAPGLKQVIRFIKEGIEDFTSNLPQKTGRLISHTTNR